MSTMRRTILTGLGALGTGAIVGCIGTGRITSKQVPPTPNRQGLGAFFTLADWTQHVAGDHLEITAPVPVGEIGHGWEPSGELQTQIAASVIFVYFDSPEFRWAQDAVASLANENTEVVTIDAMAGIELLERDEQEGHREDHEHDQHIAAYDPHVWTDPVRAQHCVDNIVTGLITADPDNADTYRENAATYKAELRALHDQFTTTLTNKQNDILVFAGHDSYQYLASRYDFTIHSPHGVSPHTEPTTTDIIDTIELVNEHDIDVIAFDYFESDALARQIVAESNADEIVPLSPAEGTTREWNDNGWGYIEQMTELNLTALATALEARS